MNAMRLRRLGWCVLLATLAAGFVFSSESVEQRGEEWPLFRFNATQTGVTAAKLPEALDVLWKFETKDAVDSGAAIVQGVVYVASQDEHVYAIDLATGKEKWKYHAAAFETTPAVRNGKVYVGDDDGTFHCLDAMTGKAAWTFKTGSKILSAANFVGDKVLFGSYDDTLYCLGPDGKQVWAFKTDNYINGSPAVVGDRTFAAGCDGLLHILNTADGAELAKVDLEGPAGASAAVLGDQLYVGTMSNQVKAVDWKKATVTWTFEAKKRQREFYSSAAVTDKLVIIGSRDKRVYGLDRQNGKEVWSFLTQGKVDGSPVVVDRRVFVGSADGNFYVLSLETGTEITHTQLDGAINGSPAVGDGCLVVGTDRGTVYCFGAKR